MAIPHAQPGEVISVDASLPAENAIITKTLFKTPHLEVIRLVMPRGKTISEHRAPGEITVQCLDGQANFSTMGQTIELRKGQMFYLSVGEPHAVHAAEDCRILLTILLGGGGQET